MTESDWLNSMNPDNMVNFLRGKMDRKLRLFFAACCRSVWHLLNAPQERQAVEVAEQYADQLVSEQQREAIQGALAPHESYFRGTKTATAVYGAIGTDFPVWSICAVAELIQLEAVEQAIKQGRRNIPPDTKKKVKQRQAAYLRCIAGNPFHPATIQPACLTSIVTSLAVAAYEERILPSGELDPTRLAVLSDALEEAGCENADILGHLRGLGPHFRGCWPVDLLLGKS